MWPENNSHSYTSTHTHTLDRAIEHDGSLLWLPPANMFYVYTNGNENFSADCQRQQIAESDEAPSEL